MGPELSTSGAVRKESAELYCQLREPPERPLLVAHAPWLPARGARGAAHLQVYGPFLGF